MAEQGNQGDNNQQQGQVVQVQDEDIARALTWIGFNVENARNRIINDAFFNLEDLATLKENYILEVSSPGMDQPFKVVQQYKNAINRQVEILKKDGIKYEGTLTDFADDVAQITVEKRKKGKVIAKQVYDIPLADIKSTKKLITFK